MNYPDIPPVLPRFVRVQNVRGYSGLPDQWVVCCSFGYLIDGPVRGMHTEGFGKLSECNVYQTRADAMAALRRLYPALAAMVTAPGQEGTDTQP